MKKITLLLLLMISSITFGQRYSDEFSYSLKSGVVSGSTYGNFYGTSIGASYIIGTEGYMADANIGYYTSDIKFGQTHLPYKLFSLEVLGGYTIEEDSLYPFYFNFKTGMSFGYEFVNNGGHYETLYFSKLPYPTNSFACGVILNPEAEIILTDNLTGTINFSQYFDLLSRYQKNYYTTFLGIKYYL